MKVYNIEEVLEEGLLTEWEIQQFSEGLAASVCEARIKVGVTLIFGEWWDVFKITNPVLDLICVCMESRPRLIEAASTDK
ncbi:hypothetical protein EWI07_06705 [Sporolactobacillus sp. THM7-4]|nr:hypothetical protein EWI07_06705 [Sporolactobacillus sp. THM7-4]